MKQNRILNELKLKDPFCTSQQNALVTGAPTRKCLSVGRPIHTGGYSLSVVPDRERRTPHDIGELSFASTGLINASVCRLYTFATVDALHSIQSASHVIVFDRNLFCVAYLLATPLPSMSRGPSAPNHCIHVHFGHQSRSAFAG